MKRIIKLSIFMVISIITFIISIYVYVYFSPKIEIKNKTGYNIYDTNNKKLSVNNNEWVKLSNISDYVKNATISIEDKNFYKHKGFDYFRILKALFINVKEKKITQGASTISQQYVKNVFLDFDKTWSRKIKEAFLTIKLETRYKKDEILEGYLNTINFGNGNYGIMNASKYYFNKNAKDLSLEESLMLVAIPKSPSNFNPKTNYDKCIERAKAIAKSMVKNNMIKENVYKNLNFNEVIITGTNNEVSNTIMYYIDAVKEELNSINTIDKKYIKNNEINIYTSLDLAIQKNIESVINKYMLLNDNTNISVIVVDPKNGNITGLTGGKNYLESQFNRATDAKRQVGSTIKPFLYYTALENGMTSSSKFLSEKSNFIFSNNKIYSPSNYSDIYANKEITMAAAIAFSDNIYAVKTHLFLGEDKLVNTLNKTGLKEKIKSNPSLALGATDIKLIDYAQSYQVLANNGYKNNTHLINKITDKNNNVLYENKTYKNLVLNQNYSYIINELLTTTYNNNFVDYTKPTALNLASKLTEKYCIKSGSTDTDYLLIGYNHNKLVLVRTGNDDNSKISTKYSSITKNIWLEIIEGINTERKDNWYNMPENVIGLAFNPIDGSKNIKEKSNIFYYVRGSEPTK